MELRSADCWQSQIRFGIPRVFRQTPDESKPGHQQTINTNLEQIYDWLTENIAGMELIRSQQLPKSSSRLPNSFLLRLIVRLALPVPCLYTLPPSTSLPATLSHAFSRKPHLVCQRSCIALQRGIHFREADGSTSRSPIRYTRCCNRLLDTHQTTNFLC